jgi:3-hydroxyacyl-[acyl-carrier-protein] dehydratase
VRYLMVDRLLEVESGKRAVGLKNVTQTEDFFTHHFPDHPVMPGALTIEAMAQTGGRLICFSRDFKVRPMLLAVEKARFSAQILPGDQMRIEVRLLALGTRVAETLCSVTVAGVQVAEAQLKFVLAGAGEAASAQLRRQYDLLTGGNQSQEQRGTLWLGEWQ